MSDRAAGKGNRKGVGRTGRGLVAVLVAACSTLPFSGEIHAARRAKITLDYVAAGSFPLCSSAIRHNCVVDGDTFYIGEDKVRISDIDAPETHPPRCAAEERLGRRATERLSVLLSAGPFELMRKGRDEDRYGRKLRIVLRDGRSIGEILISEGLARKWKGKRRPWCPDTPAT